MNSTQRYLFFFHRAVQVPRKTHDIALRKCDQSIFRVLRLGRFGFNLQPKLPHHEFSSLLMWVARNLIS